MYRLWMYLLVPSLLVATGCSPDTQEAVEADALTPEQIAALADQYPRLNGEEPLPEPTPGATAAPTSVPDRVAQRGTERVLQSASGGATFYADKFEGQRTASGIPFRQNQMVAAHRSYPFGTILRVTNTTNNRSVNVRVVDRGPFGSASNQRRAIIDLSRRAANELGYVQAGRAQVEVEVLEWGRGVATS
ncbi:MAG TPA: septal ring lytic transglycosylase RlpA family protein [Longimicrobiales bacterium]|nr:septal ring lytic transglycosylase RlpA family protein [Longimicrobiales bacterium]